MLASGADAKTIRLVCFCVAGKYEREADALRPPPFILYFFRLAQIVGLPPTASRVVFPQGILCPLPCPLSPAQAAHGPPPPWCFPGPSLRQSPARGRAGANVCPIGSRAPSPAKAPGESRDTAHAICRGFAGCCRALVSAQCTAKTTFYNSILSSSVFAIAARCQNF